MLGTAAMKMLTDENASEKYNQVKQFAVPTNEAVTKRAALGDIQNRGLNRNIANKVVAQKELKDVKARVDTHWKKQPLGVNNSNAAAVKSTATTAAAAPLLRLQSMRTNVAAGSIRNLPTGAGRASAAANAKVNATGKLVPIGKLVDGEPKIAQPKTLTFNLNQNTTIEYQRRQFFGEFADEASSTAAATSRQQRYNYNNLANMHANVIDRAQESADGHEWTTYVRC